MISKDQFDHEINLIIANAIREDVGDGDHSSLACIPVSYTHLTLPTTPYV